MNCWPFNIFTKKKKQISVKSTENSVKSELGKKKKDFDLPREESEFWK